MDIIDRIFGLLKSNNVSENKLISDCKLNNGLLYKCKNGIQKNIPNNAIIKIAQYFNVTTDYLLLGKVEPKIQIQPTLPEIEQELLNVCKDLNIRDKASLLNYAISLLENNKH